MATPEPLAKLSWMLTMASIAIVVGALYLAKGILLPLTLAVLLSFLLSPLCDRLERWRLGRIPAVVITALLAFTMLGVVTWMAVVQMTNLAPKMPEYEKNIQAKLRSTNDYVGSVLSKITRTAEPKGLDLSALGQAGESQDRGDRPYAVRVITTPPSPLQVITGMFGTLLEVLGSTGIVIVLVVFFLVRREDLRDRFIRLVGKGDVTVTTQAIEDAATRVSRYLSMQLLLNITFGVAVGIGLYLIGVPSAILWGILGATLRFIPYIGAWIAAATPIGLAMAISTGWVAPILTVTLFASLELFIGNVLEPWLYGKNTGVSPVAVLVAAVFWTWLWGAVGLLLATPLTVCLMVLGKYVPQLSFLDILLGNDEVFEPSKRVYQRLLAGDQEESSELIDGYRAKMPLVEVYDTVLVPALAMTETHWQRGEINDERHKLIVQSLKETVDELGEREKEIHTKAVAEEVKGPDGDSGSLASTNVSTLCILCLPARDEADEIAGMMLAQLSATRGCVVEAVSVTSLASEMVELVEKRKADVVCISAMPPAAAVHARYLCKRLQGRFPDAHLIVGLWNAKADLAKMAERIGCGPTTHVVGTLAAAQEKIHGLLQPLVHRTEPPAGEAARQLLVQAAAP